MTSTTLPAGSPRSRVFGEPQLHTDGDLLVLHFGPDGSLWSVEEPGVVRKWNVKGQLLETHNLSDFETLWAFSRDARVLASGSDDLTLWDGSSGHVLTALPQESWVTALAINTDPMYLATGHDDGSIRYWDLAGHAALHTFRQHDLPISALAFDREGKFLAAASEDRTISLWDVASGKSLGTLTGHTDRIPGLAWHPTQRLLVSVGWDHMARVWDASTGEQAMLLNDHAAQVNAVAFNAGGTLLACGDSSLKVRVWDFASKKVIHKLSGPANEIRALAFHPDGKTLAATGDRVIHLWDASTGQALAGAEQRAYARPSVAVHPNGTRLATNNGGRGGKVWDLASQKPVFSLGDIEELQQVAFSPDGRWLAAAAGPHVRLWDAATGAKVRDCEGDDDGTNLIAFSPDSSTIASASSVGLGVCLWSTNDGEPILLIPDALDGAAVSALAFHPDGKVLAVGGIDWLATGGSTGAVSLWHLGERAEIATIGDGATALAFHPAGKVLAATTLDHSIGLLDAQSLDLQVELRGHDDTISCLAFSPDGKRLASASDDRTLRLWTEDGNELLLVEVESKITELAFSADGKFLFTAHANTTCMQHAIADLLKK